MIQRTDDLKSNLVPAFEFFFKSIVRSLLFLGFVQSGLSGTVVLGFGSPGLLDGGECG